MHELLPQPGWWGYGGAEGMMLEIICVDTGHKPYSLRPTPYALRPTPYRGRTCGAHQGHLLPWLDHEVHALQHGGAQLGRVTECHVTKLNLGGGERHGGRGGVREEGEG